MGTDSETTKVQKAALFLVLQDAVRHLEMTQMSGISLANLKAATRLITHPQMITHPQVRPDGQDFSRGDQVKVKEGTTHVRSDQVGGVVAGQSTAYEDVHGTVYVKFPNSTTPDQRIPFQPDELLMVTPIQDLTDQACYQLDHPAFPTPRVRATLHTGPGRFEITEAAWFLSLTPHDGCGMIYPSTDNLRRHFSCLSSPRG